MKMSLKAVIIFLVIMAFALCISRKEESLKDKKKAIIADYAKRSQPITVDTSSISGRKLSDLYTDITGISGVVGPVYDINFGKLLAMMWHRKLDRKVVSSATIDSADIPIRLYMEDPKKMTLKEFVRESEEQVILVKQSLDFKAVCENYDLSREKCDVFIALAKDIRGIDLVAYGITELMPAADGNLNVKIMEILLRNAGSNYLFTIPALYDKLLSLGLYQFTSYAVNSGTKQGASRINAFLPTLVRIPGSVIELRNGEHHRAAFLFSLDNLANLVKKVDKKEFQALKNVRRMKPGDIVTFMATAHHAPGLAIRNARAWLQQGGKGSLNAFLKGRLVSYGRKSDNNLVALENKLL